MAIVPCAVQCILFLICFIYSSLYLLISYPQLVPPSFPLPFGNHKIIQMNVYAKHSSKKPNMKLCHCQAEERSTETLYTTTNLFQGQEIL